MHLIAINVFIVFIKSREMNKICVFLVCLLVSSVAANVNANGTTEMIPIIVNGEQREYLIHIPNGISDNVPLMLSLHGNNNNSYGNEEYTRFDEVADENGFIVAYPNARNEEWQVPKDVNSEMTFLSAVIDDIANNYSIDSDRVYLTGHSWGGVVACYAMNYLWDKIAAFVLSSAHTYNLVAPSAGRAIPFLRMNGTYDLIMSYTLAETETNRWVRYNGCNTTPVVTNNYPGNNPNSPIIKYSYTGGRNDVEVVLLKIKGGGHDWYGDESIMHAACEAWEFCKRFSLHGTTNEVDEVPVSTAKTSSVSYTMVGMPAPSGYNGVVVRNGKKMLMK